MSIACCYSCVYTAVVASIILAIMVYMFVAVYLKIMANLNKVEAASDRVVSAVVQQISGQDAGSGVLRDRAQDWAHQASAAADAAEQRTEHVMQNTKDVAKEYY